MPRGKPNSANPNGPSAPSGSGAGKTTVNGTGAGIGSGKTAGAGTETPERTGAGEGDESGEELGGELFSDPIEAFGIGAGAGSGNGKGNEDRGPSGRKGVKRGPYAPKTKKTVQASLEGIEAMLMSIHMMGSTLMHVPELVITEPEAKQLGKAIARVAALYSFGLSEHVMAWANLGVVMCGVYGTRAYAYHLRIKAETEKKKAPAPGPVMAWPVQPVPQQPSAESSMHNA